MEIFFADDSTQKSKRAGMGDVVAIGGVFVEDSALRSLSAAIDGIAAAYGIPAGQELKWSPRKGSWIHANLHGVKRSECYTKVLEAAAAHSARALVVCWDTGRTTLKGEKAFDKCVGFLFERITVHLAKRNACGIIVADRPGGGKGQDDQFLEGFVSKVQSGTEYVMPDRILLNVLTTASHLIRQLQLADLVTGITTAMVCGQYQYARPLFEFVLPLLIRNHYGTAAGAGLKLFPNELTNLYRWVLKEKTFWKVGWNCGFPLPFEKLPFTEDDCAPTESAAVSVVGQ